MADTPFAVYADTSVFGGVLDEEFDQPSQAFFDQVRERRFRLVTSALVRAELEFAPQEVRHQIEEMLTVAELAELSEESLNLRNAYLQAGIVSEKWAGDALHVALATVSNCSAIVSWNFQHIVHFQKISLYNGVNAAKGYPKIAIHSPKEVIVYEDEDL